MIDKIRIARWAVVGGILTAVGVAGAATKLKQPATGDACLCTPDAQTPNDLTAALEPTPSPSFASRSAITAAGSSSTAGPLAAVLPGNPAARPDWAGSGSGANGNGVGWGAGGRYFGAKSAASSGGRSASLGGLWRLINLSRRATPHTSSSSARAAAPRAAQKPLKSPRSGGGGGSASGPSTTVAATPAADLFAENTTSIPELLGGGNAAVISTPGGRAGLGGDAGSLAATPEPGPLFLVGAGLLAVASLLRRRLAV